MPGTSKPALERRKTAIAKEPTPPRVFGYILALMLFVAGLSAFFFIGQSLRLDEAQSLWQTTRTPEGLLMLIAQDVHVPLYHLILHYWQVFLGNDVPTARILSLIFFLATLPTVYFLGKLAYGKKQGLFAALLVAISPFLNWYGNEIRMYSMVTFLAALNQYFYLKIFRGSSSSFWFLYALTAILGLFTHYFFVFVLLTQAVFFFLRRKSFPPRALRNFILVAIFIVIAFAPWAIYVWQLGLARNTQPVIPVPTTINIFNAYSEFLFGFQEEYLNTIILSLWPVAILLAFLSLQENKKISAETIYFLFSASLPIIAAFVISVAVRPLFLARYFVLSVPALYLFLSWVFSTYPPRIEKAAKTILALAMLAGMGMQIANARAPVKENYRGASEYLAKNASPDDIIIVSAPFTIYPLEYYYNGPATIATLPIWNRFAGGPIPSFSEERLKEEVDELVQNHRNIWLVLSFDQGYEEKIRLYFETNFERFISRNFSPGLNLYGYKIRYE